MIDYKLVEELRKAGFPLRKATPGMKSPSQEGVNIDKIWYWIPTLSELIEEIDKETVVLWFYKNNWYCGLRGILQRKLKDRILTDTHTLVLHYEDYERGKSPEGAAAKLFIKLNK